MVREAPYVLEADRELQPEQDGSICHFGFATGLHPPVIIDDELLFANHRACAIPPPGL